MTFVAATLDDVKSAVKVVPDEGVDALYARLLSGAARVLRPAAPVHLL